MAIPNQRAPIPADVTQDWREAWSSEADIRTGEPQRAAPPAGIFTPTPDAVASALDEFLTEAPLVPAPPPAPALRPTPRPVTVLHAPAPDRRHLRSLVLGAAVAAVFLGALVIGFRGLLVPAGDDIVGAAVSPAPPPATAAPPQRMAARSPGFAADLQVGRVRGPAPVSTPDRSAPPPARAPRADPPPASAARPTPPALNTAPPPGRSSLARRGGLPSTDGAVLRSSAPALDIATRDPFVAPGAPAPLRPAPAAVNEAVPPTPETAPAPPEPTPATVRPAEAAAPAAPTDRQAIQVVLGQYQAAFNRLDANGVRAIWPGLNATALERAFGQMERQAVTFSDCSVAIIGAGASARCQGSASYVPKVGNRTERIDHRRWQIDLRKTGDTWRIVSVDTRE